MTMAIGRRKVLASAQQQRQVDSAVAAIKVLGEQLVVLKSMVSGVLPQGAAGHAAGCLSSAVAAAQSPEGSFFFF
jgi:hypothetical protein